jgi:probable F420-dependent oxidoreductase
MSTHRPFRFGVTAVHARDGAEWARKARRAEELGFSTLLVWDHLGDQLAPMPALMAAACATRTLRVGTYVLCNDFRHPALLAKEVATVDLLSGGRFELGIGAGWQEEEYRQVDIAFDPASLRVARLEEAVRLLKRLLGGEAASFQGEHYTIRELEATPRPLQRPHPPIMMGGARPRILRLAAREANIVSLKASTLPGGLLDVRGTSVARIAGLVAHVIEQAGDRANSLELQVRIQQVVVTADREGAARRLAAQYGCTPEDILSCVYLLVGSLEQIAETIRLRRHQLSLSYLVFDEHQSEQLAPLIATLSRM